MDEFDEVCAAGDYEKFITMVHTPGNSLNVKTGLWQVCKNYKNTDGQNKIIGYIVSKRVRIYLKDDHLFLIATENNLNLFMSLKVFDIDDMMYYCGSSGDVEKLRWIVQKCTYDNLLFCKRMASKFGHIDLILFLEKEMKTKKKKRFFYF